MGATPSRQRPRRGRMSRRSARRCLDAPCRGRPRARASDRRGTGRALLRLPSRTSTWASISAARGSASRAGLSCDERPRVGVAAASAAASFSAAWRALAARAASASVRAWVTSMSISASSLSSVGDLVARGARPDRGRGHRGAVAGSGRRTRSSDQSSGIRIQPWRIAYTTAWVRSLTDSLRRIELMWFLTVCSLIDSA